MSYWTRQVSEERLPVLLADIEKYALQGWSHPCSLGKCGIVYSTHPILINTLNKDLRYRLIVMKFWPNNHNVKKWIKEFYDEESQNTYRSNEAYAEAIREMVKLKDARRGTDSIYHRRFQRPSDVGMVDRDSRIKTKDKFNNNPGHVEGPEITILPSGALPLKEFKNKFT